MQQEDTLRRNLQDEFPDDQEFINIFLNFLSKDVSKVATNIDKKTMYIAVLASLIGSQALQAYRILCAATLEEHQPVLKPEEIKEIVYQATAYLGFGRVCSFIEATNDVLEDENIRLPLPSQATVSLDDDERQQAGTQAQVDIFGESMRNFYKEGPSEIRHIHRWLAANCFGDYYTRKGLDLKQRELVTFCLLAAQGGCEPQLTSHAAANMRIGNTKEILIDVVSECLPFIGYPRSLNALTCIDNAVKMMQEQQQKRMFVCIH